MAEPNPACIAGVVLDVLSTIVYIIAASVLLPGDQAECPNDCEKLYWEIDIPTCKAVSKRRGKVAGQRCYASAAERYGACLAGRTLPPLDTWDN